MKHSGMRGFKEKMVAKKLKYFLKMTADINIRLKLITRNVYIFGIRFKNNFSTRIKHIKIKRKFEPSKFE